MPSEPAVAASRERHKPPVSGVAADGPLNIQAMKGEQQRPGQRGHRDRISESVLWTQAGCCHWRRPENERDSALQRDRLPGMASNPCFETASSWKAAQAMLTFRPLALKPRKGRRRQSIRIHVRDHKLRELRVEDRTIEVHYGGFVLSQSRKGTREAQRLALEVRYGPAPQEARIAGHAARVYELGPEPEPDDIDGRSPSVVTWHDAEMFYLIASGEMPSDALVRIAVSLYK